MSFRRFTGKLFRLCVGGWRAQGGCVALSEGGMEIWRKGGRREEGGS